MAAYVWGRDAAVNVAEALFTEGHRFDFFQAVALLEAVATRDASDAGRPPPHSLGAGRDPRLEAVRLSASVSFAFPPGDVVAVRRDARGAPWMTVAFMSLGGGLGPLPEPLAELVMRSAVVRDFAPADFLDIFHHRLLSLRYRVRKQHRIALGATSPDQVRTADHLFALMGLYAPALRARLTDGEPRDRGEREGTSGSLTAAAHSPGKQLLHYVGLLAGEVRSMAGLVTILRHRFGLPIRGVPLTGTYRPIEREDRTVLGRSGRNKKLGESAVVGRRVWDQQGAFELHLGPLAYPDLLRFLPGNAAVPAGDALAPLCEITRFYAGEALDFTLRLRIAGPEAPQARLGAGAPDPARRPGNRPRLGYTAWIGTKRKDYLEVTIPPGELPAAVI